MRDWNPETGILARPRSGKTAGAKTVLHGLTGLVVLAIAFASSPAASGEVGQYRVYEVDPPILLDTSTGKSWSFGGNGKWKSINFIPNRKSGKQTTPRGGSTILDRWDEDFEKRRLELFKPGGTITPAEKPKTSE